MARRNLPTLPLASIIVHKIQGILTEVGDCYDDNLFIFGDIPQVIREPRHGNAPDTWLSFPE